MRLLKNTRFLCATLLCIQYSVSTDLSNSLQQHCWGYYQFYNRNLPFAKKLFHNSLINAPHYEKFTLPGQVELLFEQKEYKKIKALYENHSAIFEKKASLKKIYALSLAKLGDTQRSNTAFIELNTNYPDDTEIAFYAINAYINNKDLHNALNIIATLLSHNKHTHQDFIFYFLQAQIYMQMNNLVQAKASIETALKHNPEFDKGWLLFSLLSEKEHAWDKAVHGYKTFLSLQESADAHYQIQKHIIELVLAQEKSVQQNQALNHLCNRFNEALLLVKNKNYNHALTCIDFCLKQEPSNKTYVLLKIEILLHLKHFQQLAHYFQSLINHNSSDDYWYKIIYHISHKERQFTVYAISLLEKINASLPNLKTSLYLASLYMEQKLWGNASKILEQEVNQIQDPDLHCSVTHTLAVTYFLQEKYDTAITLLRKNLKNNSNHVPSLNLLAHMYITNKQLTKAEKYIAKARALDVENPHLMDTCALLYYEREQYDEARKLFDKALTGAPKDATILLHRARLAYKEQDFGQAQALVLLAKKEACYDHERLMAEEFINQWFPRQPQRTS